MIRKVRGQSKWKALSHTTGRSFGTYPSTAKAEKRLRQIKRFSK